MNAIHKKNRLFDTNGNLDLTHAEITTIAKYVIMNEQSDSNANYLEIGIFGGGTIKFLKEQTKITHFTGVDLFEDFVVNDANTHVSGTYSMEDVKDFLGNRVTLLKGNSADVIPVIEEKFNFIFIDGDHSYGATLKDFENAKKLLKPGGQIGFHNCSNHIGPDDYYVARDGGPWLVCENLIKGNEWKMVAEAERLKIFIKK